MALIDTIANPHVNTQYCSQVGGDEAYVAPGIMECPIETENDRIESRDFFIKVGNGVRDVAVDVGNGVRDAAVFVGNGVRDVAVDVGNAVGHAFSDFVKGIKPNYDTQIDRTIVDNGNDGE